MTRVMDSEQLAHAKPKVEAPIMGWVELLRTHELGVTLAAIPLRTGGQQLLEIGAGSGHQAALLQKYGFNVTAVDLPTSRYASDRVFPVIDFDGKVLPFENESFDVVYSSHVLVQVGALEGLQKEMLRVLRPGGIAVHVVPTSSWRMWTSLLYYPGLPILAVREHRERKAAGRSLVKAQKGRSGFGHLLNEIRTSIFPRPLGPRGSAFDEFRLYFRQEWWTRQFREAGWEVQSVVSLNYFGSGQMLLRDRLSIAARTRIARLFGSAASCYVLKKASIS